MALALRVVGTAVTLETHPHWLLRAWRKPSPSSALLSSQGHRWASPGRGQRLGPPPGPLPQSRPASPALLTGLLQSRTRSTSPTNASESTPLEEPRDPTDNSSRGAVRSARVQKRHPEDPSLAGQVPMALGWVGLQGPRAESSPRTRGQVGPAHEESTELHGSGVDSLAPRGHGRSSHPAAVPLTVWAPGLTRPAPRTVRG